MLSYYIKRLKEIGMHGLGATLYHRYKKKLFVLNNRHKALQKASHTTWEQLVAKHKLPNDFNQFFINKLSLQFLDSIYHDPLFKKHLPTYYHNQEQLIKKADKITNNYVTLLGSGETQFPSASIPWQSDFKIEEPSKIGFNAAYNYLIKSHNLFYKDIAIHQAHDLPLEHYCCDIKVPWELSRMQQTFTLGQAYRFTHDQTYAKTWYKQVSHWLEHNPYLLGVNWLCPMDVAIRAVNMIWGIYFFKNNTTIPSSFWRQLICSLYDHAVYLEHNWEYSDKPNNHYLADLVGYFYLCKLFIAIPRFEKQQPWIYHLLTKQFNKQIQQDGTSYEGSTSYHKLVCEMYLHYLLLSKNAPTLQENKLTFNAMITFLQDCTIATNHLVQIGDNDSGKFVTDITIPPSTTDHKIATYPSFGISIIKTKGWHITFRHPTFTAKQPSGHFHQDQLAVTVAIDQQPLLVDPGSYLYTANASWRNIFRSVNNHNTFYLPTFVNKENQLTNDLFQLIRAQHPTASDFHENETSIWGHDYHHEYLSQEVIAHRKLSFDKIRQECIIEDWVEGIAKKFGTLPKKFQRYLPHEGEQGCWTLLFHPDIRLKMDHQNRWIASTEKQHIAIITSTLPFILDRGYYSPAYGVRQQCLKLIALKAITRAPGHAYRSRKEFITISKV